MGRSSARPLAKGDNAETLADQKTEAQIALEKMKEIEANSTVKSVEAISKGKRTYRKINGDFKRHLEKRERGIRKGKTGVPKK